jgi:phosphate acetyltransferase
MTKNVFIASAEPYTGKSLVALGLFNMLLGKASKVGFFKPIINYHPAVKKDPHIETVLHHFNLPIRYEDTYAFTREEALRYFESEKEGELINTIINKFKKLEEPYDFMVIEGSDYVGEGTAFEFQANTGIARNLGAPVIIISSGENKTTAQIITSVQALLWNFESRELQVLAVVVNKVNESQLDDVEQLLSAQIDNKILLSVIPENNSLKSPNMKEIFNELGGKLLFGEEQLTNQVDNFVVGAMQLPNFLGFIKENVLIVTPGDRGDIIIGALQVNSSTREDKLLPAGERQA